MSIIELLSMVFLAASLLVAFSVLLYFACKAVFSLVFPQPAEPYRDSQYKFGVPHAKPVHAPADLVGCNDSDDIRWQPGFFQPNHYLFMAMSR